MGMSDIQLDYFIAGVQRELERVVKEERGNGSNYTLSEWDDNLIARLSEAYGVSLKTLHAPHQELTEEPVWKQYMQFVRELCVMLNARGTSLQEFQTVCHLLRQ